MTADNALRAAPPRIVQVLDEGGTQAVLSLFRLSATPLVVIDDGGRLLAYGKGDAGDLNYRWHVLPLPPLPGRG